MKKLTAVFLLILGSVSAWSSPRPRLIVMVVIDQFRADYLTRFEKKFSAKGFKYLMTNGAYFPFGEYDVLQAMTAPGHATVLTGAYPYQMGIPVNDWYDTKTGQFVYCVEDEDSKTVGAPHHLHQGTSPRNLIGTTLGDELKNADYDSKVVSLALKDRAAILMGGHRADLAFWFDGESKKWVSSQYYVSGNDLPKWIDKLNQDLTKNPCQLDTPCGAAITAEAFKAALQNYKLGHSKDTDILAVSFSSHDYAGHKHGANSKEMEAMTLAEDKALEQMINAVNASVPGGMKNTVMILTGDHGIVPKFDVLTKAKIDFARLDATTLTNNLEAMLSRNFPAKKSRWIAHVGDLNFFLDEKVITQAGVEISKVEAAMKAELEKEKGFAFVFTATDYKNRQLPPLMFERQILKTYYKGRSGNVIALVKPFYTDAGKNNVTHMTGYSYDRTVPIIFAGPGIKKGIYAEKAEVVDIAPTLAFLVGTLPPALSEGRVLKEILLK